MFGLLVFDHDWADEFDVTGFRVLNEEENKKFKLMQDEHPEFFKKNHRWSFGSNEGFDEEPIYDSNHITHKDITEEEYNTLLKLFEIRWGDFGQFPYIMDDINSFLYNLEHGEID